MGNPASNTDYPRYGSLCSIRSACLIHKSCHPCHQCASSALAVHRGRWRLCTLPSSSSRRRSTTAEAGANHVVAYALASPGSAKAKAPHCGAFCDISWRRGGDSNPRYLAVRLISSQVHSTTLPPLRTDDCSARSLHHHRREITCCVVSTLGWRRLGAGARFRRRRIRGVLCFWRRCLLLAQCFRRRRLRRSYRRWRWGHPC